MKTRLIGTSLIAALLVGAQLTWGLNAAESSLEIQDKPTAPEFTSVTEWINSKELKLSEQKGKVKVIHFWTFGCINCIHNYPHYRAWMEKYKDQKDFLMVGIHTPELARERDIDTIKKKAKENKLTFPIAVDNDDKNWVAWGNRWWPCVYIVDKDNKVLFRWEGELGDDGFKRMTAELDKLLELKK
jgi:thiol-disulfide isomerase/thioredoxin